MSMPDLSAGLCRGMHTSLFFPWKRGPNTTGALAKQVCNAGGADGQPCPVRDECREWALHHELFGCWGGTSERQRRMIRRDRNIIVHVPAADPWFRPTDGFSMGRGPSGI